MTAFVLLLQLVQPASQGAELPAWYSGRHAVLIVVDGLGDGVFEQLVAAGQLGRTTQRFVEEGTRVNGVASFWPGRGAAEAHGIARGRRLPGDGDRPYFAASVERWPASSFAAFGFTDGAGLKALSQQLQTLGSGDLPPILSVVHEGGYADAVRRHGATSAQATEALVELDRSLVGVVEAFQRLGLGQRAAVAVVSPAGVAENPARLDAAKLFAPLLPRRTKRSTRLRTLLETFDPAEISIQGNVALLLAREAVATAEQPAAEISLDMSLRRLGVRGSRAKRLLTDLSSSEGIAFIVARESDPSEGERSLLVMGEGGTARLEQTHGEQLRYQVLQGRDPLALGVAAGELDRPRFHASAVWRDVTARGPMPDALARVVGLFSVAPEAVLVAVARRGSEFDASGFAAGAAGRALLLTHGVGTVSELTRASRATDVFPTLLALVGAPEVVRGGGEVVEELVEAVATPTVREMCRSLVQRAVAAFTPARKHDASVIDTTEIRRFGAPLPYFRALHTALVQVDPESFLPEELIQRQIGPRRSLLVAASALAGQVEKQILRTAPNEIRRFDPLIRPELMLAGFLDDPVMRARMRIIEGPLRRARQRGERVSSEATGSR